MDSQRAEENNEHDENGHEYNVQENGNYRSGDTTPDGNSTVFSGGLRRTDSKETLVSSTSTEVESNPSIFYPAPPANTPATQSLAGDIDAVNLGYADEQLSFVPGGATPPNSLADPVEGKAHLRARVRGDVPLLQQLFKRPPRLVKKVRKVTRNALIGAATTEPSSSSRAPDLENQNHTEHFHEHSTWVTLAKEDICRGLERLAMAAKDLNKIDESVTVEQYYSEHLAEVLKEAEIKLDSKYLE